MRRPQLFGPGSLAGAGVKQMTPFGDLLLDTMARPAISEAGGAVGGALGGVASDALTNMASSLSGAATGAGTGLLAEALDALGPVGAAAGKAIQAASPIIGAVASGASKAAGLPLQAAGAAVGKTLAPMAAKMGAHMTADAATQGLQAPDMMANSFRPRRPRPTRIY